MGPIRGDNNSLWPLGLSVYREFSTQSQWDTIKMWLRETAIAAYYAYIQGRIQGGARAPPLISRVVIFQPIIVHTINPPFSDMLVPAPSTPKYIPLPI